MSVARRAALLTIVAAMAAMLLAVHAPRANAGFFGLNYTFHELQSKDPRKLKQSGAKNVRWTFYWPRIERSKGQFDWSVADEVVGDLASKGIRILPVLDGTPSWVAKPPIAPPIGSKQERTAWKGFLRAAVRRYGPGGTFWTTQYRVTHLGKKPLPITMWQIWNEPNLEKHFSPHPSPGRYARLLKLSNRAIDDADPGAKVMFAGMPGYSNDINAWKFLKRTYGKKGTARAFDATALHAYARNVDQMMGEVRKFRRAMRKHGDRRKPIWITEVGWGSKKPNRYGLTKGLKGQKRILKRSFRALKKKRRDLHIKRVLWFDYRDPKGGGNSACSFCTTAGLLRNDFRPKPAWRAFRSFTH
jgi:hypothetical protein